MTFRILTEGGDPLLTEGGEFLVIAYEVTPVAVAAPTGELGYGDNMGRRKCPMCDGELFYLYGLRCSRCGTRIVHIPGREID